MGEHEVKNHKNGDKNHEDAEKIHEQTQKIHEQTQEIYEHTQMIYEHTQKIRAHALSWSMGAKATCLIVSETKGYLFTPAGNADLDKTLAYGLIRVRR